MKKSLFEEIVKHIDETLFGKKYYFVLLSRPNLKVKGQNGKHPYETSCDIFFSYEEAKKYYDKMHDDQANAVYNTHQIVSFRSRCPIPLFNQQRNKEYKNINGELLVY